MGEWKIPSPAGGTIGQLREGANASLAQTIASLTDEELLEAIQDPLKRMVLEEIDPVRLKRIESTK